MVAVVVELSRFLQGFLTVRLQEEGWVVHAYDSGLEALEGIRRGLNPRIVFSSHVTRDLDGIEFRRRLTQIASWESGVTVLVTSDEGDELNRQAREAGYQAVLPKHRLHSLPALIAELCAQCNDSDPLRGRILYVEDSPTAVSIVRKVLQGRPVVLDDRPSVDAALEALRAEPYDLVITDYTLEGGKNGLDLVRALRRDLQSKVPILVLSGLESSERKIEILRSGANDFVAKPVLPGELTARAATLLQNKHLIDELENKQQLLYELAMKDPLTGLLNRRSLFEMAPKELANAKRHQYPVSLLLIDLDHFKKINDTHGHQTGDVVLREVGALLPTIVRAGDFAARFGGEEFVILLLHCGLEDARNKAEMVRRRIEELKPGGLTVTGSFGVAVWREDWGFEEFFRAADEAAYAAKANGRNRVETAG